MKQAYLDIIDKLGTPLWWDEVGCPRYNEFYPDLCNNIYAKEATLVLIECQACRFKFNVCFSCDNHPIFLRGQFVKNSSLAEHIRNKTIDYCDPPNYCCQSGATMTSNSIAVIQYWKRENFEWIRDKTLEILLCD